jgi:carbonic anhydrase
MNETVIEMLAGNSRHTERIAGQFDGLQESQAPDAVTVCCGDSRVMQDAMWANDQPGYLFTHSNIGNRVVQETDAGPVVAGDVLYPLVHTGTETAIVVGHTGCGAVTATYEALTGGIDEPDGISYCVEVLETQLESALEQLPSGLSDDQAVNRLVEYNVDRQVEFLTESNDLPDPVTVVGAVYDFHDVYSTRRGEIHVVNVDGERDVEQLRTDHPDIESRISRNWEY